MTDTATRIHTAVHAIADAVAEKIATLRAAWEAVVAGVNGGAAVEAALVKLEALPDQIRADHPAPADAATQEAPAS